MPNSKYYKLPKFLKERIPEGWEERLFPTSSTDGESAAATTPDEGVGSSGGSSGDLPTDKDDDFPNNLGGMTGALS